MVVQDKKSSENKATNATQDIFNELVAQDKESDRSIVGFSQAQAIQYLKDQGYDWPKIKKFLGLSPD